MNGTVLDEGSVRADLRGATLADHITGKMIVATGVDLLIAFSHTIQNFAARSTPSD